MSLFEFCIRRPVLSTVLSLLVLVIGAISYTRLDVREYPRIDEPVVSVQTTYPGASADVIESQITKVLEDSLAGIEGVELLTSQSRSEQARSTSAFASRAIRIRPRPTSRQSRARACAPAGDGRRAGDREGRGGFVSDHLDGGRGGRSYSA